MDNALIATVICRECGCTDLNPCEGPCFWVEPDLCSRCQIVATLQAHGFIPFRDEKLQEGSE